TEASETAGDQELARRLKEWVVQKFDANGMGDGGKLPVAAPTDSNGEPFTDPKDDQKPSLANGNFAKIRLPGGWCYLKALSGHDHNQDNTVGLNVSTLGDERYTYESDCWKMNSVLGKIPLIATVEKLDQAANEWKPAENVWVHFQLVKPYELPDWIDGAGRLNTQPNRPNLVESVYHPPVPAPALDNYRKGANQKHFTETFEAHNVDPQNPQVNNCHVDCGGKRVGGNPTDGTDVVVTNTADEKGLKNLFWVGEYPGFTTTHNAPPAGFHNFVLGSAIPLPPRLLDEEPALKAAELVTSADHPHCVRAQTNDVGEAGVIFMPSRCAGDRYRIRAYVGPTTLTGDAAKGKGMLAVRADTGTFVIWRNIRVSRLARQPINALADIPQILATQWAAMYGVGGTDAEKKIRFARKFSVIDAGGAWSGLPNCNMNAGASKCRAPRIIKADNIAAATAARTKANEAATAAATAKTRVDAAATAANTAKVRAEQPASAELIAAAINETKTKTEEAVVAVAEAKKKADDAVAAATPAGRTTANESATAAATAKTRADEAAAAAAAAAEAAADQAVATTTEAKTKADTAATAMNAAKTRADAALTAAQNALTAAQNAAVPAAGDGPDSLRASFARAYCEVDFDPGWNAAMTNDEWRDAVMCGITDAQDVGQAAVGAAPEIANLRLPELFFREGPNPAITVSCGFHYAARSPWE
ncbi:MAG: hypothetical protein JSU94_04190, partial [Phycisphaerales bacterium]